MPGGDGTGPAGMGPMTGRAAGYCAGYSVPGFMNPVVRRGYWGWGRGVWGRGRGDGRGWRNWFYATGIPGWTRVAYGWPAWGGAAAWPQVPPAAPPSISAEQELEMLKQQAGYFRHSLDEINKRIEQIEADSKK